MEDQTLFDETIKKIEFIFRYAGVNIRSKPAKSSEVLKTRLVFIYQFLWFNTDLGATYFWFIDGLSRGEDFLSLTYNGPCMAVGTLATIKGCLMWVKEKQVHQLMNKLRELERKDRTRESSPVKKNICDKERFFLHTAINTIIIIFCGCIFFYTITPIIIMWLKYKKTNKLELILPFFVLYPFDAFNFKVYPFIYVHLFLSEIIVWTSTVSADFFFFVCATYIKIQFGYLQYHIKQLPLSRNENSDNRQKYCQAAIKKLALWHEELIECGRILEDIYSFSILLNYMSSCLTICLAGFNVTKTSNVFFIFISLCGLSFGMAEIFLLCLFADHLKEASAEVSDAIYNCKWYDADPRTARSLLIMIIRAQKPCTVTAAGFADVTFNSFMKILSTSWSYFALLQTIYGNQ